jgi:murein DD-endopeptidase MepM/ murein hydrolase activator NlpD
VPQEEAAVASRKYTVVLLPDDDGVVRQFRLDREVLRGSIGLALCFAAVFAFLATAALVSRVSGHADAKLVTKNEVLERELEQLSARLDTLDGWLARVSEKDEHYRLLAGLDPLGDDVLQAGIGGPDADSLEAHPLFELDTYRGAQLFAADAQANSLIRRAGVLVSSWTEAERVLTAKHARFAATPSIYPTTGRVSSAFTSSRLHPILHRPRPHMGIDIVAPVGTPVIATAHGSVRSAASSGDYGLLIEIDHGYGMITRYAHLSRIGVRPGQEVQRGQQIGAVGTSGLSAGPHLHYEVIVNGRPANPRRYILEPGALPD